MLKYILYKIVTGKTEELGLDWLPSQEDVKYGLLVSDSAELCKKAQVQGMACVGIVENEDLLYTMADVKNISIGTEGLDDDFLQRVFERTHLLPHTVGNTKRLMIRELRLADLDALYTMYQQPEFTEFMPPLNDNREEESAELMEYIRMHYAYCEYGNWGIVQKESHQLIGRVNLNPMADLDGLELGYALDVRFWHCGYAYEACRCVLQFAAKRHDYEKCYVRIHPGNDAAASLAGRLGFRYDREVAGTNGKYLLYMLEIG